MEVIEDGEERERERERERKKEREPSRAAKSRASFFLLKGWSAGSCKANEMKPNR